MTISFVAHRHGISPSLLFHWRRRMAEGGKEPVRADDAVVSAAEVRALEKLIRELERVLGRKTLENEILREAVKVAQEKADLAVAVVTRRGFAVKAVVTTLGVSRPPLHERLQGRRRPRRRHAKAEDGEFLPLIRSLVDECPTYGYRRIGALVNRQCSAQGLPRLNHKRIYRMMAQNGMLLAPHAGTPPGRPHEGQIISIRPNLCWRPPTASISRAGALRWFESPSPSTPVTGRPWRGKPRPTASVAR
jgi:transposase-like protein